MSIDTMNDNTVRARSILIAEGCTCVICNGDRMIKFTERGVKPLLSLLDSGTSFKGYSAADKVVGKASAMLYELLEVDEVYAPVMSTGAIKVLTEYGITEYHDEETEMIINRQGTGMCPMEDAVKDSTTAEDALQRIRKRLSELNGQ